MSVVAAPSSGLRRAPICRTARLSRPVNRCISLAMQGSDSPAAVSTGDRKPEAVAVPRARISSAPSDLRFDRLQPSEEETGGGNRREFGRFIARGAAIDEEYWTAAWLRAETNWEDQSGIRHVESYKRQFAEQEFSALKKRCNRQHADKSICFVAVKKEEKNSRRTVLSSIAGTLDVSIRHLVCGQTFPAEPVKAPVFWNTYRTNQPKYGYVSNLCVAKYARRQGIASNMLLLAMETSKSYGADLLYVHVHKDNLIAQKLYDKMGFQMVEVAPAEEQMYLMCSNI